MHIISGRHHKGHTARLRGFDGDSMTADCQTCKAQNVVLKPTQVKLSEPEIVRMRESYDNYLRGGKREGEFWRRWVLADGGVLARRVNC